MTSAHAVLASGTVSTPDAPDSSPPWRWRAFKAHTAAAGFNDARARALFLAALIGADDAPSLSAVGERLGTCERTVVRARVWIKANDHAAWELLRPREAGPTAALQARIPGWTPETAAPKRRRKPAAGS